MPSRVLPILPILVAIAALARADTPIQILCPANSPNSPCESIQILLHDTSHGSITITMSTPKIQQLALNVAGPYLSANLPAHLTQQLQAFHVRYVNGRILLHQVTIAPSSPCGHIGQQPCPPAIGSRVQQVSVNLIDEYQKEIDHWKPFPLFKGHWSNDGWPTLGKFTIRCTATFGVDAPLKMSEQHAVFILSEDSVDGNITQTAIHGPFSFSLGGKKTQFSFPLIDSTSAAKYGLTDLSVTDAILNQIDSSHVIITGIIGPAQ
jgi:hypothetical protein